MEKKTFRNMEEHIAYVNNVLHNHDKLIIFDTETTGLASDAKIIQFSAVLYENDNGSLKEIDNMDVYLNPGEKLDPVITELTGISDDMLKYAANENILAPKIMEFMGQADLWSAYNINFDLAKIEHMCARTHIPYQPKEYFDTMLMAKNMISKDNVKNHKLGTIVAYLLPDYEAKFHNSLEDVRATGAVLNELAKMYSEYKPVVQTVEKKKLLVDWASYWKNPHMGTQRRITIFVNRKNSGIFWDVGKIRWSHKADKDSAKLFEETDIADIERQVMTRYGKKYNYPSTMEELGILMEKDANQKERDKRAAERLAKAKLEQKTREEAAIIDVEGESEEIDLW